MDTKTLQDLGLNKNEIDVYIELNNHEDIIASQLAKKLTIQRPNVYDALQKLVEKGLAKYYLKLGKRFYQATKPEKLLEFFEQQKEEFEQKKESIKNIVKELNSFRPIPSKNYSVSVLEGIEGIRSCLMDSINHCIETRMNEDLAIRLNEEDLAGIDPTFAKKYYNLKNKHKIKTKFLVLEGKEFKRETAIEVKTLPKEYSSPTNMFIYGHKVAIWLWPRAPAIILIENKETADSYRKQFELMWKQANKLK